MLISQDSDSAALKLMEMPGQLRFAKDGSWWHDDVRVSNEKIARYFARHLQYLEDRAEFAIVVGQRCVVVGVEDTPWVVSGFETSKQPWQMILNTGELQTFDPSTLSISDENVLYSRAEGTNVLLRILRPAMQGLWPLVVESSGQYFIELGGQRHPITSLDR